ASADVFTFTALNPSIANCAVLGPNERPLYEIYSDASMSGYTILSGVGGELNSDG
ncbi:hypothetical protein BDZ89DRAFT_964496, partial [Hymenopellis radicata]